MAGCDAQSVLMPFYRWKTLLIPKDYVQHRLCSVICVALAFLWDWTHELAVVTSLLVNGYQCYLLVVLMLWLVGVVQGIVQRVS